MQILPHLTGELNELLKQEQVLLDVVNKEKRAVHVVIPSILSSKIKRWQEAVEEYPVQFYVAHKATKSPALIAAAKSANIGIDVSSLGELNGALKAGFSGNEIECTGPKNDAYLQASIENNCLISVDSLEELKKIADTKTPTTILLRINSPSISGREYVEKRSKFGMHTTQIDEALSFLDNNKQISLKGFHFHQYGYTPQMKAGIITYMLSLIQKARSRGHDASVINVGGAIPAPLFKDRNMWQQHIQEVEKQVIAGVHKSTWGADAHGLRINERGKIQNRERAESPAHTIDPVEHILNMLDTPTEQGVSIGKLLIECQVNLIIEPGFSLLYDCGCTLVPVIETKEINDGNLVICDANMFTLSSRMFTPLADPLLIPQRNDDEYNAFVAGTLCREDDVLMGREVTLPARPANGDILFFANTAAYQQGYELCTPQLQTMPAQYVASLKNDKWQLENQHDI